MDRPEPEAEAIEKVVKISRVNPENKKSIYSNDFLVTHTENEFFLTFSLIEPIYEAEQMKEIESIDAIARVKIVLTPSMAEAVLQALTSNIERYKERFKKDDETNGS